MDARVRHVHAKLGDDIFHLRMGGALDGHVGHPFRQCGGGEIRARGGPLPGVALVFGGRGLARVRQFRRVAGVGGHAARRAEAGEFFDQRRVGGLGAGDLARDGAFLDQQDAVRERGDEVEALLHEDDGDPGALVERLQEVHDLVDDRGLDALGGLIQKDQVGL